MTKLYSKLTGGFYPASVQADYVAAGTWPADAALITESEEVTIRAGLAAGSAITGTSGAWIVTSISAPLLLAAAQSAQIAILSAACANAIAAGFTSSALGSIYTYPSKVIDQLNLNGSITDSLIPGNAASWTTPLWRMDSNSAWAMAPHTAAQVQVVGRDCKVAVLAFMNKNIALAAQVMATTSVAAAQAIIWS